MKITFVMSSAGLSGGTRVIAEQSRQLIRLGHQVNVVSRRRKKLGIMKKLEFFARGRGWTKDWSDCDSHIDMMGIPHIRVDTDGAIEEKDIPDADAVIATWWETAEWVAGYSEKKGAKFYYIQHDERIWYEAGSQKWKRASNTWNLPIRKIVVSEWLADLVKKREGQSAYCIPNSVNLVHFAFTEREKRNRPSVGFVYQTPIFKGLDTTLKAIKILKEKFPNILIFVFGEYAEDPLYRLPKGCNFALNPKQTDIPRIYASCDVWLVGSRSEGFGLPLMEAMACGTPVVSTRVGAAPDLLADGGGFLVDVDDAEGLANRAADILLMSDEAWKAISLAAAKKARSWDWAQAGTLLEKVILERIKSDQRK